MLIATKMGKTSSECSKKVMGFSSGFSTTLKQIQVLHFVLLEVHSKVKKSLLLNIQAGLSPLSMRELL
jgi:hypothetical protein